MITTIEPSLSRRFATLADEDRVRRTAAALEAVQDQALGQDAETRVRPRSASIRP